MYIVDEEEERKEILKRYKSLMILIPEDTPKEDREQVKRAFALATKAHANMRRKTGEPYIYHPLAVARIAAEELGLGTISVTCGLLHDVVEDTEHTLEDIRTIFGDKVAQIVNGLTKTKDIFNYDTNSIQSENFKKLIAAMGNDIRVILLKLCDRLHNMRTLDAMPEHKQLKIASETRFLYVPLAHRLGLYAIKSELEDLATSYLNPHAYKDIKSKLADTEEKRNDFVHTFSKPLEERLKERGFSFSCTSRVKSITSILNKIEKKHVKFEEIYDIFAIRLILDIPREKEAEVCFSVYGIISSMYEQRRDRFRDWVSKPKPNGYEAIHTTVMSHSGKWVEIQIRSKRMDEIAEKGLAAHYKYKEIAEGEIDANLDSWLGKVREMLENPTQTAIEFVNDFKVNLISDTITVFTPKGKMVSLPSGSSILDFAFEVNPDLGFSCMGGKVNYRAVSYSYKLKPSDQVEVITSKIAEPSNEWLQYVKTPKAEKAIQSYLHDKHRPFAEEGKKKLQSIFKNLHIEFNEERVKTLQTYSSLNDLVEFYHSVYKGEIGFEQVKNCFAVKEKVSPWMMLFNPFSGKKSNEKKETGLSQILYEQAKDNPEKIFIDEKEQTLKFVVASCCNPLPGDSIVGLKRKDTIEVHRTNCSHALEEMSQYGNRIIKAKWRENEKVSFLAGVRISGIDRKGLLQELTGVISDGWNLNIRGLSMESSEGLFEGSIMVYISDNKQLENLIRNIEKIDGIQSVKRI